MDASASHRSAQHLAPPPDAQARLAAYGAAVVTAIALVELLGWALGVAVLTVDTHGLGSMQPWTAVALALLGFAVATTALDHRPRLADGAAVLAGAISAWSGLEYLLGSGSRFDTFLFHDNVVAEAARSHPGRMAPLSAACITLTATAIVLRLHKRTRLAHTCLLGSLPLAAVTVVGYLYNVDSLHEVGPFSAVSLPSAFAILLLDGAVALQLPTEGLMRLARRGRASSMLVRRGLPILVIVPLVVGWLRLEGQRAGLYDTSFGVAITAVAASVVAASVLWRAALSVARSEDDLTLAIARIAESRDALEAKVALRTTELAAISSTQRASLDSLEQGVALATLDGEVLLLNRAGQEIVGYTASELSALFQAGMWETFREDGTLMPASERPIRRTMDTGEAVAGALVYWRTRSNDKVLLRVNTRPVIDADGERAGVAIAFADVTAEHQAELELRASRARFAALVEHSNDVIAILDRSATFTYVSPAGAQLLCHGPSGAIDLHASVHPDDWLGLESAIEQLARTGGVSTTGFRTIDDAGHVHHVEAVLTNRLEDPSVGGLVVNLRDVTERAEAAAKLQHLAFHDALTGLPNRALLLDRLGRAVERDRRRRADTALLYIDLDGFKQVNDQLGHEAGDELLAEVGDRLREAVRSGDTVARLGGDEFVVLAENLVRADEAEIVAERIIRSVAEPFLLSAGQANVSASIGIAHDRDHDTSALLRHADAALYQAKRNGRNRFEVFDESNVPDEVPAEWVATRGGVIQD